MLFGFAKESRPPRVTVSGLDAEAPSGQWTLRRINDQHAVQSLKLQESFGLYVPVAVRLVLRDIRLVERKAHAPMLPRPPERLASSLQHAPNCPRNGPGDSLVPGLEQCNKIARQYVLLGELLAITDNPASLGE